MMNNFKNQVHLAFFLFATVLGVLYYAAIEFSVDETEAYLLKGYLQGAVDNAVEKSDTQLPELHAIALKLIDAKEIPVELDDRGMAIYSSGDKHRFIYIRPWGKKGQYVFSVINENAISDFEKKENDILNLILFLAAAIVIVSWFIGVFLSHIISLPLSRLAKDVSQVSPYDTNVKVKGFYGQGRKDEIGHLSRNFNALMQRVSSVIQNERAFNHHVSHELRTPLALINNATTLLKRESLDTKVNHKVLDKNIERIDKAVERIDARVRLFLHLGLQQQLCEAVNLRVLWSNTVNLIQQQIPEPIPFKTQRISDIEISASPVLIHALLENSLLNAVQYGNDIEVELNEFGFSINNQILLSDDQCSINQFGYGVEIMKRACEAGGWDLNVRQARGVYELKVIF